MRCYVNEARDVFKPATVERAEESLATTDISRADTAYAVAHKCALSVVDVADRHTRMRLVDCDREAGFDEVAARTAAIPS